MAFGEKRLLLVLLVFPGNFLFKETVKFLPGGYSSKDAAPSENPGWFRGFDAVSYHRKEPEKAFGIQNPKFHPGAEGFPKTKKQGTHGCTIRAGGEGSQLFPPEVVRASAPGGKRELQKKSETYHNVPPLQCLTSHWL